MDDKLQFHFLAVSDLKILEADIAAPLNAVLQRLGQELQACTLWVARPVTTVTAETALRDLGLRNGDCLLTVAAVISRVKLTLLTSDQRHFITITKPQALIGRRDEVRGFQPDVDLTPCLRHPAGVSRRQAWLIERGDRWEISLPPEARTPVFVDGVRLEPGRPLPLCDGTLLAFGGLGEQPEVSLQVRLE